MAEPSQQIIFGASELAQAFPARLRRQALAAAESWGRWVRSSYASQQFAVQVEGEQLLIPQRLFIEGYWPGPGLDAEQRDMGLCLASRSTDGRQRQRALREIVTVNRAWTVPFVLALTGDYVVQILDDIEAALSGIDAVAMGRFIAGNPACFALTKARVASYWNEYYRLRGTHSDIRYLRFARDDYVGFRLIDAFEKMAAGF
jgi:hypothetical protein